MEKKIRVFIALKIPGEWEPRLAELQTQLKNQFRASHINWVDSKQAHITLRFLGYISPEQIPLAKEAITWAASRVEPFQLSSGDLGCFPSAERPRVIWLGLEDSEARAATLCSAITTLTEDLGEPPDKRGFTPHLTLARVKSLHRDDKSAFKAALGESIKKMPNWHVSELLLMQSHLSQTGARYELLYAARLGIKS